MARIAQVRTWAALQRVHNLTAVDLRAYYVVANDKAVLGHDCGNRIEGNLPVEDRLRSMCCIIHDGRDSKVGSVEESGTRIHVIAWNRWVRE